MPWIPLIAGQARCPAHPDYTLDDLRRSITWNDRGEMVLTYRKYHQPGEGVPPRRFANKLPVVRDGWTELTTL